jgi:hypothetical protein
MKGLPESSLRTPVAHQIFNNEIGYDNHKSDANAHDYGSVKIFLVTWCSRNRRYCKSKAVDGFAESEKADKIKNYVKYVFFHFAFLLSHNINHLWIICNTG